MVAQSGSSGCNVLYLGGPPRYINVYLVTRFTILYFYLIIYLREH